MATCCQVCTGLCNELWAPHRHCHALSDSETPVQELCNLPGRMLASASCTWGKTSSMYDPTIHAAWLALPCLNSPAVGSAPACSSALLLLTTSHCTLTMVWPDTSPNNCMQGSLPAEWGMGLSSLTVLDLSANNFTGVLPSSWGTAQGLSKLLTVRLHDNSLAGRIPQEWFQRCLVMQLPAMAPAMRSVNARLPAVVRRQ